MEEQLKSWKPRRPSAKLERRLFGTPAQGSHFAQSWGWLAPAAACVLLVGTMVNQQSQVTFSAVAGHGDLVDLSMSNQSYASYLPGSFKSEQNRWDTFEWTNGGDFNSSVRPFPRVRTNGSN